ncbi:YceI family protein [Acuticoccus sp. M5D2P5]|uniref:YceI family protein n=1 Tax=Acuticoccus kalidii TaxID=2910977 RepID=UPI001F2B7E00|nr:YceI family protein [Acuticoccus kalidii]MCF3936060.1 YceI family protein [Acuticoccus kalidii]
MNVRLSRIALAAAFVSSASVAPAFAEPRDYEIDPTHFAIVFNADHIGYGNVWGLFVKGEGSFTFDEESRELSDLTVTIDASSAFTGLEDRDEHIRGADFVSAEEHPEITFVMTDAEAESDTEGKVMGDLTLRGVTKPVTLDVTLNKIGEYPFGPNYVIGITAKTTLKRSEWGMTYAIDNGLVGDEVPIVLELEAIRQ